MCLQSFLRDVETKGENHFYVFFKDENGIIQNICYQSRIFFQIEGKRKIRMVNPIRAVDTLERIQRRELQVIGCGYYAQNVDFVRDYNRRGVKNTWKH